MYNIAINSFESNEKSEKINKFVAVVKDVLVFLTSDETLSLEDAEDRVSKIFRDLEQMCLELRVSGEAVKKESEPVSCPVCQQPCRPLRKQEKHFTTLCGKISVNR